MGMKTSGILNIWYFWHFGSFFQLWEREFGHITYVTKSAPKCQMGTKTPDFWLVKLRIGFGSLGMNPPSHCRNLTKLGVQ